MHDYLEAVVDGRLPVNRDIIALMQDIFNLLPNLNIKRLSEALTGAPRSAMHDWLNPLLLSTRREGLPSTDGAYNSRTRLCALRLPLGSLKA